MGRRTRPDVTRCTWGKSRVRDGSIPIPRHAFELYDEHPLPVDNFRRRTAGPGMLSLVGEDPTGPDHPGTFTDEQ
ncbi:hypothetical protein GCM10010254_08900 [Streptomyces chromofuscus]|nr:hypothetical protein GCM10010254_08900 [Streptomyces chromofuscus]